MNMNTAVDTVFRRISSRRGKKKSTSSDTPCKNSPDSRTCKNSPDSRSCKNSPDSRSCKTSAEMMSDYCAATSLFVLSNVNDVNVKMLKKWSSMCTPTKQATSKAPFHSPFEGTINLSMSAKESVSTDQPPSHKGFLTIFQEESGLGAWNRRWCSVQDNKIYYWLYPEDEVNMNKEPHGEIDLRNCKTERVSVASRLDCARPNTFVLTILTASQPGDRNSIITETNNKTTQTKYLLSADSREERKQWMEVLNKCLLTVISWNH